LEKARLNTKEAGFENEIIFEQKEFSSFGKEKLSGTMISNPPY
jgi:23S rRNA G2445 N2-methylase RlmL